MNQQQMNAQRFIGLLERSGINPWTRWEYRKLKASGYMDLSIDRQFENEEFIQFAIAHNGLLNGDIMADPDMEIRLFKGEVPRLQAIAYQNDYAGAYRTIIGYEHTISASSIQRDLDGFLETWLINLRDQGFAWNPNEAEDR